MALYYVIVLICVLLSVHCHHNHEHGSKDRETTIDERRNQTNPAVPCVPSSFRQPPPPPGQLYLPSYALAIIVFCMVLMLIVIIYLVITLTRIKRNIYINNDQRRFFRENTNWRSCESIEMREKYRNNESTLTVNSGVIEGNRYSEPETPTRRPNDIKIYVTKPATVEGLMHRKQIEELITVLNKTKKTASTSLRELNELQNEANNKPMIEASGEKIKEVNNVQNHEVDVKTKEANNGETTEIDGQRNDETNEQKEAVNEKPKEEVVKKEEEKEQIKDEIHKPASVLEIEVYDTVPTPKRTTLGSDDIDSMALYDCPPSDKIPLYDSPPPKSMPLYDSPPTNNMPLYDCPPTDNMPVYDCLPDQGNVLLFDPDTEYLMPLSRRDTNTYINARTSRK